MADKPEIKILPNVSESFPVPSSGLPYRVSINDSLLLTPTESNIDSGKPQIKVLTSSIVEEPSSSLFLVGGLDASLIKILYESNSNTNAFIDEYETFIESLITYGFPLDFDVDGGIF